MGWSVYCANCFVVPSANKRDLRSIEEAMQDIRSKKKLKLMPEEGNNQVKADSIPNGR